MLDLKSFENGIEGTLDVLVLELRKLGSEVYLLLRDLIEVPHYDCCGDVTYVDSYCLEVIVRYSSKDGKIIIYGDNLSSLEVSDCTTKVLKELEDKSNRIRDYIDKFNNGSLDSLS